MATKSMYPLAENAPDLVKTPTGKSIDDVTVDAVLAGDVSVADFGITPEALRLQAEVAQAADRRTLAENFHRGAELVNVPQDVIMQTYEMLRPGRSSKEELIAQADTLRRDYGADLIANLLEEAAAAYARRGIFAKRY